MFAGEGDFFFFVFFATVAQVGAGKAREGLEGGGGGGIGAEVDSGWGREWAKEGFPWQRV